MTQAFARALFSGLASRQLLPKLTSCQVQRYSPVSKSPPTQQEFLPHSCNSVQLPPQLEMPNTKGTVS